MKLYNSLSKTKEDFKPLIEGKVSMYHCGPTVYDHVHIGNLRSFLLGDFLRRSFEYAGYSVTQVMNITDIGHLVSDGDSGDDKMTKALVRQGKEINLENMLEVASTYRDSFVEDLTTLNINLPHHLPKASDHIQEDIDLITKLEEKGFTYTTSDGVYFDTSRMPDYGALGGVTVAEDAEARIIQNQEKKQNADFALWKFDDKHGWNSPWGQGFPGWHIECSGMSIKYLGEQFDIHTGGVDLKSIHHNNEIAQSECATGTRPFVKYWLHGEMLNMNGAKLSKSTGGDISLKKVEEQGYEPLSYRYLTLQTHYRSPMNFSWEILESAERGFVRLKKTILELKKQGTSSEVSSLSPYLVRFNEALEDDMNLPQALAVLHELLKSDLSANEKLGLSYAFDHVFGLGLEDLKEEQEELSSDLQALLNERKEARAQKNWERSDELRTLIEAEGYQLFDSEEGQRVEKK